MANELRAEGRTAYTHYAQIYDETNQVWNGSAFVALSGATWTATAVTLTETPSGSGVYLGTFPAGITTAGLYTWRACERQGGSAANTDPPVWSGQIQWGGSAPKDLSDVPADLLDATSAIETSITMRTALKAILAACAGQASGAGTTTMVYKSPAGTTRVTATVDGQGNRSAITISS